MKKVVWTAAAAALALVCVAATPAAAQGKRASREDMRARIEKRADKRFKKLDRNGDGVIDRSEWTHKAKKFDRFDRDHDGTLGPDEFRDFVRKRARRSRPQAQAQAQGPQP
jgi:Ca2+-binding EF-hand superfamily protein